MTDKEKEATIHKVYHDPAGFGSINNTLRDAQAIDKTIKIHHVKELSLIHISEPTRPY